MKNFIQPGDILTLTAPSGGVVSGNVYKINDLIVVAVHSAAVGEDFEGRCTGVMEVPKASADSFSAGAKIYWNDSSKEMTTTSGGNTLVGVASETVASGIDVAPVRWNGSF